MQPRHSFRTAMVGVAALLVASGWLHADGEAWNNGADEVAAEWRERLADLHRLVDERVERELNPQAIAERLGILWPVFAPKVPVEDIRQQVALELAEEAREAIPNPDLSEVAREFRAHFTPWRVGDSVRFTIRGGVGPNSQVEGTITLISDQVIRVGVRWIQPGDLDDETRAKLFPKFADKLLEQQLQTCRDRCEADRRVYVRDRTPVALEHAMRQAGYLERNGEWLAAYDVWSTTVDREQQQLRAAVEEEVFTANGFQIFRGEWQPVEAVAATLEAERLATEQRRSLIRESRKQQELWAAIDRMKVPVPEPTEAEAIAPGIIEEAAAATVLIRTPDNSVGSGFFVTENGYLMTNYHVIAGAEKALVVTQDGKSYPVDYVAAHSKTKDLALLKVEPVLEEFPFLRLSPPGSLRLGEPVFVIGHPQGHAWTFTKGYVAGMRTEKGRDVVQFSADISPGSSGGPVLDQQGQVCAIATYIQGHGLHWGDGTYTRDPSDVFKFGIACGEFAKAVENPERLKPVSLAKVAAGYYSIESLKLVALLLLETDALVRDMATAIDAIEVQSTAGSPTNGNGQRAKRQYLANDERFQTAAVRFIALNKVKKTLIPNYTGNSLVDSAIRSWFDLLARVDTCIDDYKIAKTAARGPTMQTHLYRMKPSFDRAEYLMYQSLLSAEKGFQKYRRELGESYAAVKDLGERRRYYHSQVYGN